MKPMLARVRILIQCSLFIIALLYANVIPTLSGHKMKLRSVIHMMLCAKPQILPPVDSPDFKGR
jgi:hypothetical protein